MPLALIEGLVDSAVTTGTAGVTTQTFDTGLPFTPVAAMFQVTRATVDDTATAGMVLSQGFTDGTNQAGTGVMADDAAATTGTTKVAFDDAVIRLPKEDGSTFLAIGSFDSFVTGGVKVLWDQIPSGAYLIQVTLWFGDNVEAAVGVTTPDTASSGASTISTGFTVQHMIVACTGSAFNEAHSKLADLQLTHVIQDPDSSGTISRFSSHQSENAKTTSEQHIRLATDGMVGAFYRGGALPILNVSETHITKFDSDDGFEIFSQSGLIFSQGPTVAWLALTYGPDNAIDLGHTTTPGGTGVSANKSGFESWAALIINTSTGSNSWDGDDIDGEAAFTSYGGFFNSGEENVMAYYAEDAAATTNTESWSKANELAYCRDNSSALLYEGNASFDASNGTNIDWSTVPPTVKRQYMIFQLERDKYTGTGAGSFPLATGAAVGSQINTGTGAGSFPLAQASAVGEETFTGTGTGTFPLAQAAAVGTLTFTATGAGIFPLITGAGAGTADGTEGAGAGIFPLITGAATGLETFIGTGAGSFPLAQATTVGITTNTGTGAGTFPLAIATGAGLLTFTGAASGSFPLAQATGTGEAVNAGIGTGLFPLATASATGLEVFTATSAGIFPLITGTGVGNVPTVGVGAGFFPLAQAAASGIETFTATSAGIFPLITAAGSSSQVFSGSGNGTFPLAQAAAAGLLTFSATGSGTFPLATVTGAGLLTLAGTGTGFFPLAQALATGLEVFTATGVGFFPLATAFGTDSQPLGCTEELLGTYLLTTALNGTHVQITNLTGTYIMATDLTGDFILSTELDGSYDQTTDLSGGIC